jgi:hypothetical protein
MVPQHVNEAADQAAKRIITTRVEIDGKMLGYKTPIRGPVREPLVLGWRTSVGPAEASRALSSGA